MAEHKLEYPEGYFAIIAEKFDINLSFEEWLKKRNNYNKETLKNLYNEALKLARTRTNIHDNGKKLEELDSKGEKAFLRDLNTNYKRKLKELETENKKIQAYRDYTELYKNIGYAAQALNAGVNLVVSELEAIREHYNKNPNKSLELWQLKSYFENSLKKLCCAKSEYKKLFESSEKINEDILKLKNGTKDFSSNFLDDLENDFNFGRKKLAFLDCSDVAGMDFKKKSNALVEFSKKEFKKYGADLDKYLLKNKFSLRSFLSFFGKKINRNVRDSDSGKYDYPKGKDFSGWMGELEESLKLSEIIIPASHNAGTYGIKPKSTTDVIAKVTQNQSGNIYSQLKAGIRSLDWRMKIKNGVLIFAHDQIDSRPVAEGVKHLLKFLKERPSEIVFLTLGHCEESTIKMFKQLPIVKNELLRKVYTPPQGTSFTDITLSDVRKDKKQLVLLGKDDYKSEWSPKTRELYDDKKMVEGELGFLKDKDPKKLHKITPIHTANRDDVIRYIFNLNNKAIPLVEAQKNFAKQSKNLIGNKDFRKLANMVSYDETSKNRNFTQNLIKINKYKSLKKKYDINLEELNKLGEECQDITENNLKDLEARYDKIKKTLDEIIKLNSEMVAENKKVTEKNATDKKLVQQNKEKIKKYEEEYKKHGYSPKMFEKCLELMEKSQRIQNEIYSRLKSPVLSEKLIDKSKNALDNISELLEK